MQSLLFLTSLQAICKYIPPAQARDFLTAVLDSLRHVRPTCVKAVWKWVCRFLVESTEEIVPEVKENFFFHSTLPFLLLAVALHPVQLARAQETAPVCRAEGLLMVGVVH